MAGADPQTIALTFLGVTAAVGIAVAVGKVAARLLYAASGRAERDRD